MKKNEHQLVLKKTVPAKKWKVLRLLARIQDFSKFMPNVQSAKVVSKEKRSAVTEWTVQMSGIPMKWTQQDTFDFKNFSVHFELIDGDIQKLEGTWKLEDSKDGQTDIVLTVNLRLGLPQIEETAGEFVAKALRENFQAILNSFDDIIAMQRYAVVYDRKHSDVRGFAVICHPYNYNHLVNYLKFYDPNLRVPSREFLAMLFQHTPSYASLGLKDFRSKTGKSTHGYFIMCPIIPDMLSVNIKLVVEKVVQACKVAEGLGLGILALGGFTSIAGEMNNKSIRQLVNIPVTTGNTYTAALALDGVKKACDLLGKDLSKAKVTIIGGAGDIGGGCARILAEEVREVMITSRSEKNLSDAKRSLSYINGAKITTCRDNKLAVKDADVVIAAASTSESIVTCDDFKSGAIVCDIGYPKNISNSKTNRKDIFVFSGGIASLPSEFNFGFDVGLPSTKTLFGCYSEAIILDLEEKYQNFSEGKGNITREKVNLIKSYAEKHGFGLAPFFWGDKLFTEEEMSSLQIA